MTQNLIAQLNARIFALEAEIEKLKNPEIQKLADQYHADKDLQQRFKSVDTWIGYAKFNAKYKGGNNDR